MAGMENYRMIADIFAEGENIANILIEAGMAMPYDNGTYTHNWCE